MFWMKKDAEVVDRDLAARVAEEAERLFRHEKMHCAEAVLASLRHFFMPQLPYDVVQLAGGFGHGSGAGCICGAIAGATMGLGLLLKGEKKKVATLTRDLHLWFNQEYGATCCKVLSAHGKKGCVKLTASVAGKTAELLLAQGVRPRP